MTPPPSAPASKRVALWIRVSTEDQAKGDSPQNHEERGRQYAAAKGWTVVEVYHLEGVSGKSVMGHSEAKRMMKDVERGHIAALIFSKLARLGRNTRELLEFSEFFKKHDADLVSLQESIDTSTPASRLFYTMIAGMAHWEREEIGERIRASIPVRAKQGKQLGGPAPFGYRWEDKALVLDAKEAPVRRLIHELFLEHRRKKTVCSILNDQGHRTRAGANFTFSTVDRLLRDPAAKGLHRVNYTARGTEKTMRLKPESEWIYAPCPAIVSEEVWDRCNAILRDRDATRKPPAKRPVHLFAGLVHCECGRKMYVPSNTPKYVCQTCRTKIPIVDLEATFEGELAAYRIAPGEVETYLAATDEMIQAKTELLAGLSRDEKSVRDEMNLVYKLYVEKRISTDGFGERYKPLEERVAQIRARLPELEAEIEFLKHGIKRSAESIREATNLAEHWPTLDHAGKRKVVEAIVERIEVGDDSLVIDLFHLPSDEIPPPSLAKRPESPIPPNPDENPKESSEARPIRKGRSVLSEVMSNRHRDFHDLQSSRRAVGDVGDRPRDRHAER